jgi:hypothetical protein
MSVGLREYARHRRCALNAVQTAIKSGRLSKSLTKDGRIRSIKLADAEWAATTQEDRIPISGPAAVARPAKPASLQEARARREMALARIAEIELEDLEGELIPVAEARADIINKFAIVRTRLLAVPSKLAQQLPSEKRDLALIRLVEDLIREGLEELAASDVEDES